MYQPRLKRWGFVTERLNRAPHHMLMMKRVSACLKRRDRFLVWFLDLFRLYRLARFWCSRWKEPAWYNPDLEFRPEILSDPLRDSSS